MIERPVAELLSEYQDYVLAYRLRALIGGGVASGSAQLTLGEYAGLRLERQALAARLVNSGFHAAGLDRLETLTELLMFGFWLNPAEVAAFLRAAISQGTHLVLADPQTFEELLSVAERNRLGPQGVRQVCSHYLACLTLAAPMLDPDALNMSWRQIEETSPPIFLDGLSEAW